jgi:tetratricopeptide (TPR) repeat protein
MKRVVFAAVLAMTGCAIEPTVPRVYDGHVVEGEFVPSEAYAAYLKGVLAEEAGDYRTALGAYEETVKEDDEDPEPFTRIGDMRCRLDPKDRAADDAFAHAHAIDHGYAPLALARARCAAARGQDAAAAAMVEAVGKADRQSPSIEALYVSLGNAKPSRTRALALTVASGEHVVAWEALIAWARTHNDAELLANGLIGLLHVAPMRASEVEAGAVELLGQGQLTEARRVAIAAADASPDLGVRNVRDATVARLAIDEALVRGDLAAAERRATRGHIPRSEIAARALFLERGQDALALAVRFLAEDPTDAGAAMVVRAIAPSDPRGTKAPAVADHPPAACALAMARELARAGEVEAARTFLNRVAPERIAPHDPLIGSIAVDLTIRGAIADASLPIELRLEVAARRRDAPPVVDPNAVDAKHALLFHSMVDPTGAPARALLAKIGAAADRDPLIGYALARAALAAPPTDWTSVRAAIKASPTDPLVLAVAVELALKNAKESGKADEVAPARARLLAVARTPAERALARP